MQVQVAVGSGHGSKIQDKVGRQDRSESVTVCSVPGVAQLGLHYRQVAV